MRVKKVIVVQILEVLMKEIKLGTIGSGIIVRSILNGVKQTEGIRCVAVYSRTYEKGKKLADEYGVSKIYTDMETFLADEEMNFVYIATPNLLHYQQTKKALLAGKNVICEKPFCKREEQAAELIALAKEKGLFLVEAAPTTFLPNYEILKRELPKIGRIRLVMSNFSQYSSRYDNLLNGELPNVFNPDYAGGCLMDINFYNVYLNVALFGSPEKAVYYPNFFTNSKIDISGMMVMQYEDFVSQNAGAKDTWGVNFFQIEGEKGYIYVTGGSSSLQSIKVVTKNSEEEFNEQPSQDRWLYEVQNLTKLILAEDFEAIYHRLDITLNAVRVMEKARKDAGIYFPGDILEYRKK